MMQMVGTRLFFLSFQLTLAFLKVDYDKVGGKYLPSLFPNGRYKYVIKMFYHNITYGLVTLEMFINAIGILNND